VSERDEPGMDDLERQLDAAFAATRPRRGFEDELWTRIQARRPWWRRLGGSLSSVTWAGATAGALAVVLVVGLGTLFVLRPGASGGGSASTATSRSVTAPEAAGTPARAQAPGAAGTDLAGLPYGRLPLPAGANVPQVARNVAGQPVVSPLPSGPEPIAIQAAGPQSGPTLPVYRYAPGSGPASGTILEPGSLPPGLPAAPYPARTAGDAVGDAGSSQSQVTLNQGRLVYVAVVANGQGYLEPAYLYTGTARSGTATVAVQLLMPALAPSVYR
jgi:hypothetical protein